MNSEEFEAVLAHLKEVTTSIGSTDGHTSDVAALKRIGHALDKHRLEMEAAETGKPEPTCPGALIPYDVDELSGRLDAIEERLNGELGEPGITETVSNLDQAGVTVHRCLRAHVNRFEAIEKRYGTIAARVDEIQGAYKTHMEGLHKELSIFSDAKPVDAR